MRKPRPWPLPFIMDPQALEQALRETRLKSDDLIKIILALARYHATCYKAREKLADELNKLIPDIPDIDPET